MAVRTTDRAYLKEVILDVFKEVAESGTIGTAATNSTVGKQWVEDILDALKPLQALSPSHGEIPKHEAPRIIQIQDALRRADLSKAVRPADASTAYYQVTIFATGSRK